MTSSPHEARRARVRTVLAPACATFALCASLFAFTTIRLMQLTDGNLTYALDDAYIHMAIAKNLALHGVWGVGPDTFSASSSSPLWTALLGASFRIVGVWDVVPLLLNSIFAVFCIVALAVALEREQVAGLPMFTVMASVVLGAPLVPMVWIGMEHTLHILLTVLTAWGASSLMRQYSARRLLVVCAAAAFMVAARYEGVFVVVGCAVVFALSRRMAAAVAVTFAGALPVVGIGLWNLSHGWFFLPTSILLKQTVLPPTPQASMLSSLVSNVANAGPPGAFVALLVAALGLLAYQSLSGIRRVQPLLIIFVTAALLHLPLAKFGWLFRYESYLMALGALAVGVSAFQRRPSPAATRRSALVHADFVIVAAVVGVLAFGERTIASNALSANVAGHIYRQHRQVAQLLQRYSGAVPVAVNDIGVVSYYTHARVYDLVGLGSLEVARLSRAGLWDAAHMNALLEREHVDVALVYDTWFQEDRAFHRKWKRIGEWNTDPEDERGEGTVTFFARNAEAGVQLRAALRAFDSHLPAGQIRTRLFEVAGHAQRDVEAARSNSDGR